MKRTRGFDGFFREFEERLRRDPVIGPAMESVVLAQDGSLIIVQFREGEPCIIPLISGPDGTVRVGPVSRVRQRVGHA